MIFAVLLLSPLTTGMAEEPPQIAQPTGAPCTTRTDLIEGTCYIPEVQVKHGTLVYKETTK